MGYPRESKERKLPAPRHGPLWLRIETDYNITKIVQKSAAVCFSGVFSVDPEIEKISPRLTFELTSYVVVAPVPLCLGSVHEGVRAKGSGREVWSGALVHWSMA